MVNLDLLIDKWIGLNPLRRSLRIVLVAVICGHSFPLTFKIISKCCPEYLKIVIVLIDVDNS